MHKMGFREWLQEMWMKHKDEYDSCRQTLDYDSNEYFKRYKYWLKREYKFQRDKL